MNTATSFRGRWDGQRLWVRADGCYLVGVGRFSEREVEQAEAFLRKYHYEHATPLSVTLHLMRRANLFLPEL